MASLAFAVALAACGGGSSDSGNLTPPPSPPPTANSVGGIWYGLFQLDGGDERFAEGLILEDGRFHIDVGADAQLWGELSVSGDAATGQFQALVAMADDTAVDASGTLDLVIVPGETLEGTFTIDIPGEGAGEGTFSLLHDDLYLRPSTLAELAGDWVDVQDPTELFSVSATGAYFQQDPESSCVGNGEFSVPDSGFNAYVLEADISGCQGPYEDLNGAVLSGLFFIDDTGTAPLLVGGMVVEVPGTGVVLAGWWEHERP